MRKLFKKFISQKVVQIVSLGCQLLRTVGLLAVRVGLAKLRLKNSLFLLKKIEWKNFRPNI